MHRVLWILLGAALITGCKDDCDRAADVLAEKCGIVTSDEDREAQGACDADSEILSRCINENEDRTCAQIQEACFGL